MRRSTLMPIRASIADASPSSCSSTTTVRVRVGIALSITEYSLQRWQVAEMGGAVGDGDLLDGGAANDIRLPGSLKDIVPQTGEAADAVGVDVVGDRKAAKLDGMAQDLDGGAAQAASSARVRRQVRQRGRIPVQKAIRHHRWLGKTGIGAKKAIHRTLYMRLCCLDVPLVLHSYQRRQERAVGDQGLIMLPRLNGIDCGVFQVQCVL
jgi:hypothetical protein